MTWEFITQFSIDTIAALLAAFTSIIIAYTAYKTAKRSVDQTQIVMDVQKATNRPSFDADNTKVTIMRMDDKCSITIAFRNIGGVSAHLTTVIINNVEGVAYKIVNEIVSPGSTLSVHIGGVKFPLNEKFIDLSVSYFATIESGNSRAYYDSDMKLQVNWITLNSDVYISYSEKDNYYVVPLIKKLIDTGVTIYYDASLSIADTYTRSISKAIVESNIFVVIITENSSELEAVISEIDIAYRNNKTILPIFINYNQKEQPSDLIDFYLGGLYSVKSKDVDVAVEAIVRALLTT